MDFGTVLLIFFLLVFVVPQVNHWLLLRNRKAQLSRFAKSRGSNVITMIHRQERVSFLGIPFYKYIDIDDSEKVLRAIRLTPDDTPIDLILHTPGGLVLPSAQIAMALKDHPAETRVLIPHYAMSGGTLLALACDKIIMDPHAVLGSVDPQLGDVQGGSKPAASIIKIAEEKGNEAEDETLILADISEKAICQLKGLVFELTGTEKITEELVSGKFTHDYPITVKKAKETGIEVSTDVPPEVYQLMDMYPQRQVGRPTVEYIPTFKKGEE